MVKNKSKDGCFYMKSSIACVTGYRPQKCPWGFNEKDPRCINMKNRALIKFRCQRAIHGVNETLTPLLKTGV